MVVRRTAGPQGARLASRAHVTDIALVKPAERLRRLRRLATRRGLAIEISEGGSHTKVRLGGRTTVVGRHPGDMPPGTFRKVLKDVGLTPGDLED